MFGVRMSRCFVQKTGVSNERCSREARCAQTAPNLTCLLFNPVFQFVIAALAAVAVAQNPDADAQVLSSDSVVNPDGSYQWNYETSNGIRAQEQGVGGQSAQGSASWTDPIKQIRNNSSYVLSSHQNDI